MKKAGWPKARRAHSAENRVGQSWKEKTRKEQIEDPKDGKIKIVAVREGHFTCRCNAIVRIDKRGFAACEVCGEVYNDGPTDIYKPMEISKRALKRLNNKFIYDCLHTVV